MDGAGCQDTDTSQARSSLMLLTNVPWCFIPCNQQQLDYFIKK